MSEHTYPVEYLRHVYVILEKGTPVFLPSERKEPGGLQSLGSQRVGHVYNIYVVQSLSHVQLCNPTDCSTPGSSVHGVLQTRILVWVAMPSSRESSQPRDRTQLSHIAGGFSIS